MNEEYLIKNDENIWWIAIRTPYGSERDTPFQFGSEALAQEWIETENRVQDYKINEQYYLGNSERV